MADRLAPSRLSTLLLMTFAGLEKRLPKWARDLSIEWIYRLCQEPKRLWKRYLVTNSMFVALTLKLLAQRMVSKKTDQQVLG